MLDRETVVEKKKFGIVTVTMIIIVTMILTVIGSVAGMRMVGKASLSTAAASAEIIELGEKVDELETNGILYKDGNYVLNEDLVTVLVMGIDKETVVEVGGQSWEEEEGSEYAGGQADALFLLLINPHDKNVYVISINRNSMAEVDVFDEEGNYQGIFTKQIALQHGYGDGKEESCLRQKI